MMNKPGAPKRKKKALSPELQDPEFQALMNQSFEEDMQSEGAPEWMTTFSDMMTLLLCFFILMFSMSEINVKKFMQAAESLYEGFGQTDVTEFQQLANVDSILVENPHAMEGLLDKQVEAMLQQLHEDLQEFIDENELHNSLKVENDESGVTLSIRDLVLFISGSADLEEQGRLILFNLVPFLMDVEIPVVISGHTDNRPIDVGVIRSNWELSALRAAGIARVLGDLGLNSENIRVEAYGEFRPETDNDTPEGRASNRRVELLWTVESARAILMGRMEENIELAKDMEAVKNGAGKPE